MSEQHLILLAAGSGVRVGGDLPKQYITLCGKKILEHSLDVFVSDPSLKARIRSISIVIDAGYKSMVEEILSGYEEKDLFQIITGGKSRKRSVYNSLLSLSHLNSDDVVLIHDAARPFVKPQDVHSLLDCFKGDCASACLASAVQDTMKFEHADYVPRESLYALQTPQAFEYGKLMGAHEKFRAQNDFTDDTSLMAACGHQTKIITSSHLNFKITTPDDLLLASALINERNAIMETVSAQGYDVHAFEEGEYVTLCGVEIPHDKSLKGHSDADVAMHALTDALLGSVAEGDIGKHFPPSDSQWKNAASEIFLKKSLNLLSEHGAALKHIDITVICEKPKLAPYIQAMRENIAMLCDIPIGKVSIKATTTEKLGFTGREEGIAAQALVSVARPDIHS